MSDELSKAYLGDGLYASYDGWMITLETERTNGRHWVALEREVFESLLQFAMAIGWLKEGQHLVKRNDERRTENR